MPSVILGNVSGGQQIILTNIWSGIFENHGVQLRWAGPGNAYVSVYSNVTVNSGTVSNTGVNSGGTNDGMIVLSGERYNVPPLVINNIGGTASGIFNIYALCDAASSGVGRMYFEPWCENL